jgi:hypothetical protein
MEKDSDLVSGLMGSDAKEPWTPLMVENELTESDVATVTFTYE